MRIFERFFFVLYGSKLHFLKLNVFRSSCLLVLYLPDKRKNGMGVLWLLLLLHGSSEDVC